MSIIECVLFDCDGTLVDSEVICCQAYVNIFEPYGVQLPLTEVIQTFKGMKLYDIIERISTRFGLTVSVDQLERHFRAEVARLFDLSLQPIPGVKAVLDALQVPTAVVSNGPVSKMQHSLGLTGLLPFFGQHIYSGYDIGKWKPDPTLLHHAAREMGVEISRCILVEDSVSGTQAGIAAGIPVFYYCADAHNAPLHHPRVTMFHDMAQLPTLWQQQGWKLTS
ncbi:MULTISPECIES: 6-phosphogluconate phosphatase [Dickeya]|uniref:Phosphoenolpyruvate and 6-phosphogluconate phosphatase. YieH is also a nucleotidase hydrolyzing purines and pyrimidines as secondary substrates n=1 Tax=Dickeya aquatica TaxID=1401087 RepID=A0A375AHQ6_9GAMM|nr:MULTISPECIES: 6-phosphogluconate phosphatase [Dickeya]SLM65209.1 Phosphoenolpyruvate and 6-phosphogluconate phosphatase. YieH is also a nucleotidase hydrolyzing purines and pyrimidines as secondary substrates [Dickeya aquatica]